MLRRAPEFQRGGVVHSRVGFGRLVEIDRCAGFRATDVRTTLDTGERVFSRHDIDRVLHNVGPNVRLPTFTISPQVGEPGEPDDGYGMGV